MFALPRNRLPELMDQPGLDDVEHRRALRALRRVNRICRTAGHLWDSIERLARQSHARPLRVLDVASGGGDIVIDLARRARRAQVSLEVSGCDLSPTAVAHAHEEACAAGFPEVRFFTHDVLEAPLPDGFDVVTCTLFLHHLDEAPAVTLLERMVRGAAQLALLDDLRRTRLGYCLAWCACRMLTRSPIVHVDGPRSVQGAFTSSEAVNLARLAGWQDVTVRHHWPERFLMSGRRA